MAVTIQDDNEGFERAPAIAGGQSMEDFAATLPDDASQGFAVVPPSNEPANGGDAEAGLPLGEEQPLSSAEVKRKRVQMSRKMRNAMNKLKDRIASAPALWFDASAKRHAEWKLDDDEKELINDSVQFALEVLDVNFEIEAVEITLRSIWWVIMYPVSVIGLTFFAHKENVQRMHPEDFKKEKKDK